MEEELSASFDDHNMDTTPSTPTNNNDSTFKAPKIGMSLRERKRKQPANDETPQLVQITPKRGRPKGSTNKKSSERNSFSDHSDLEKTPRVHKESREDLQSLCAQICLSRHITSTVDKWLKKYDDEPEIATVQLLQLFVSACGCLGSLDSNMIHTMNYKSIIDKLSDKFPEDMTDYPIIQTNTQWKRFRTSLSDFITLFVMRGKTGPVSDVTLMDGLIQLLTGMAESQIRAFRHTATFSAMKLSSSLVDIVVELVSFKEKNNKQIDTEKAKLRHGASNERLEFLLKAKGEYDSKMEELCSIIQYIFRSVFVHRYRDKVADIRSISIHELGSWMRVYPALFLDDTYLKYIGWSLFDKAQEVRMKCLDALIPLYEDAEMVGRLELFTNKFKTRLGDMVRDADTDVAVKACKLVTAIYRVFPTVIEKEQYEHIYDNVYSANRFLAVASAEFVNVQLLSPFDTSMIRSQHEYRQSMIDLISFSRSDVHKVPNYLVDAMIDVNPIIKDWNLYIEMLLSDDSEEYDDKLVSIMCAAVAEAVTGDPPPGRLQGAARKGHSYPAKDPLERERLTVAFIPAMPKLLRKFIADQNKTAELTSIFMHLQLGLYATSRQENHLIEFLHVLQRVIECHSDDTNTINVAKILSYLESESEYAISQTTEPARLQLIGGICAQFTNLLQRIGDEPLDDEDEALLLSCLRRMVALIGIVDIVKKDEFWDPVNDLIRHAKFKIEDIAEKSVLFLYQVFVWEINKTDLEQIDHDSYIRLKKMRDEFLITLRKIISFSASGVINAYTCLCDVLIMLNYKFVQKAPQNEYVKLLAIKVDNNLSFRISQFVIDNVILVRNLSEQGKVQLLYKKRNLLCQFVKLITYSVLPILEASQLLRYYTKFFNDYGDILKSLLHLCRENDRYMYAKAIVYALQAAFKELKGGVEESQIEPISDEFTAVKDLAKRFALSFGSVNDYAKIRDSIVIIHKEGIYFALDVDNQRRKIKPNWSNLSFFEILLEFSSKIKPKQDKAALQKYLEENSKILRSNSTGPDDPNLASYYLYQATLNNNHVPA